MFYCNPDISYENVKWSRWSNWWSLMAKFTAEQQFKQVFCFQSLFYIVDLYLGFTIHSFWVWFFCLNITVLLLASKKCKQLLTNIDIWLLYRRPCQLATIDATLRCLKLVDDIICVLFVNIDMSHLISNDSSARHDAALNWQTEISR